jgi:hypothetical protein
MSLSLWNWGKNSLQYQQDIVETEFKEIASKGARVSLAETKNCGEKRASQSEERGRAPPPTRCFRPVRHGQIDMQNRVLGRLAREKTDRRIMRP